MDSFQSVLGDAAGGALCSVLSAYGSSAPLLTMTELSPSARAVLTAVTLKKYDVPPEELPAFAEEMAPLIAAALHAAAYQLLAVQWKGQIPVDGVRAIGINWARDALHVLANELEVLAPDR